MPQPEDAAGAYSEAGLQHQAQAFAPGAHFHTPQASPAKPHADAWGTPVQPPASPELVPPGMDRDAFVAGERAAMARALQMMLPAQQTLGMLAAGLQKLELRVHDEATHSRQTQLAAADARAIVQALSHRLEHLEKIRLPGMEGRLQHAIEAPLSQEFQATLMGLQDALQGVGAAHSASPYTLSGFLVRQLSWLAQTAALYARQAISRADVAAVFLSHKILLDARVAGRIEGGEAGAAAPSEAARSARAVTGALLFLAAVEACWQTHARALALVPARVQRATAPAQLGLRILRGATWAATLTLSAVYFRRACHMVADQAISGLDRAVKRCGSLRPFSGPVTPRGQAGGSCAALEQAPDESDLEQQQQSPTAAAAAEAAQHFQAPQKQRSIFDTPPPSPQPSSLPPAS